MLYSLLSRLDKEEYEVAPYRSSSNFTRIVDIKLF
jgi:hypothetical protein